MFKKVLAIFALAISFNAFAEASFNQVETLIEQKQFQSAEIALEGIIANHPNSAKAFYAMSQAQAGLGNLEKAQFALNKARALDPELKFASSGNIDSLQQAITPQVAKIEVVRESHFWRITFIIIVLLGAGYIGYTMYKRKQDEEEKELSEQLARQAEAYEKRMQEQREAELARQLREQAEHDKAVKAEEALKAHKNYGKPGFDPENPDKLKTKKQLKDEAAEKERLFFESQARREAQARADAAEASARMYRTAAQTVSQPAPTHTTVVNNSNDGFVTGMLVGNMLSGSHHDHTTIIERDVYVAPPTPSYTPPPSRSSWDDDSSSSSSSKSSSWDSDDSSSKSSSWSSSSSSSDSDSWSSSSSSDSSWSSSDSSSSDW